MTPVEIILAAVGAGLGYGLAFATVNSITLRLRMRAATKYNRRVAEAEREHAKHDQPAAAPPVVEPEGGPYL